MTFELIHKPTFTNQLVALPRDRIPQILEKIELLRADPAPHGGLKKKLHGYAGDVYRLRSGDYRIVYTYGDGWVTLLGVDDRKDIYRGDRLVAEAPAIALGQLPDVDLLLQPQPVRQHQTTAATPPSQSAALPVQIDVGLLTRLRVPLAYHAALCDCRTVDELLAVEAPPAILNLLFDTITAPDFDRVLRQPSFATGAVDDLLRFVNGELIDFLLKLNPEQERFVTWAINGAGPVLVKGGPGTGKSTIALYRARTMLSALRPPGGRPPRLLFTTYTNALVSFSEQLLRRLLGPDADRVEVRTADSLAVEIVRAADGPPTLAEPPQLRQILKEAIATAAFEGNALQRRVRTQAVERLSPDYLLDELSTVIEARELASLDAYLAAPRAGRQVPLNATQRAAIWRVFEAFGHALARHRLVTWQQVRRRAAVLVRDGRCPLRYDGVLVDEAQDLDPTMLRLLLGLCASPDGFFVTADANQSIYGSGFRWTDVHADLRFQGRTGLLKTNHRSTREIGEAARAYLQAGLLDSEPVEPAYVQSGPPPAVRAVARPYDETQLLARFLPGAARSFQLGLGACAVLVPTEAAGQAIAARLTDAGVEAVFMPGRALDLQRPVVKVITLKSAKGLEFPIVALAGFLDSDLPGIPRDGDPEETEEALRRERRTLYVAMTRAMRALLVITPADSRSPLVQGFKPALWNTGAPEASS